MALFLGSVVEAQNVGIGTTTPNANAALEIKSNNKGLLMPRLSTTARNSMTNVAKGMLVYDTTNGSFYYHDGGKWLPISQTNSDSALTYTYPGIDPVITNIATTGLLGKSGLYGTLYDNGGPSANYIDNCNGGFRILNGFYDGPTVIIKVDVLEMNLESPYDSLEIFSVDDYEHKQLFTGNRTGTFYFNSSKELEFRFRSNGVNNLSGFKINWTKLKSNVLKAEAPPLIGWYFNSAKIAARGGINTNNNWAAENLGLFSFAYGQNAVATGDHSSAIGINSAASGNYSMAIGAGNFAGGENSTTIGTQNKANGSLSTALGFNNTTNVTYTTAIGIGNVVSGLYSTAIGFRNRADGSESAVMGTGLITKADHSQAGGKYNDTTGTNKVFEIGNGNGLTNRSNAVTVLNNGNTGIGTIAPTTTLDVNGGIRTKYSGSAIVNVTGTGSAASVNLTIPALPAGWDFTNTLVMVSVVDGTSGIIYQTKLTSTTNIQLFFEANATGATRFNYIVFKL